MLIICFNYRIIWTECKLVILKGMMWNSYSLNIMTISFPYSVFLKNGQWLHSSSYLCMHGGHLNVVFCVRKGFVNHVTIEAKHTIMRNMKIGFSKNIWNFMNANCLYKCDCIFEQDEHVDQKILIRVQIDFIG